MVNTEAGRGKQRVQNFKRKYGSNTIIFQNFFIIFPGTQEHDEHQTFTEIHKPHMVGTVSLSGTRISQWFILNVHISHKSNDLGFGVPTKIQHNFFYVSPNPKLTISRCSMFNQLQNAHKQSLNYEVRKSSTWKWQRWVWWSLRDFPPNSWRMMMCEVIEVLRFDWFCS